MGGFAFGGGGGGAIRIRGDFGTPNLPSQSSGMDGGSNFFNAEGFGLTDAGSITGGTRILRPFTLTGVSIWAAWQFGNLATDFFSFDVYKNGVLQAEFLCYAGATGAGGGQLAYHSGVLNVPFLRGDLLAYRGYRNIPTGHPAYIVSVEAQGTAT